MFPGGPPSFLPLPVEIVITDSSLAGNSASNVINASGLSGTPTLANYTTITHASPAFTAGSANAWSSIDPSDAGGDFFAQIGAPSFPGPGPGGYFDLSFNTPQNLTDLVVWGYSFGGGAINGSNVSQWRIQSFDSANTPIGDATFTFAPGNEPNTNGPSTLSFGQTFSNVSRVQVVPLDNYFGQNVQGLSAIGGDRIGVAELRFIGDAVPEPSTGLLSLLAVGGLALRRRRA